MGSSWSSSGGGAAMVLRARLRAAQLLRGGLRLLGAVARSSAAAGSTPPPSAAVFFPSSGLTGEGKGGPCGSAAAKNVRDSCPDKNPIKNLRDSCPGKNPDKNPPTHEPRPSSAAPTARAAAVAGADPARGGSLTARRPGGQKRKTKGGEQVLVHAKCVPCSWEEWVPVSVLFQHAGRCPHRRYQMEVERAEQKAAAAEEKKRIKKTHLRCA
ncbi:hypothetical protein ACP70R_041277 [Stipagrostis hirtigluma subsp. patula]